MKVLENSIRMQEIYCGYGYDHGGEYTNIIADHVVLNGNIRAVHEETYMALEHELERNLQEIEKQTAHRSVWNFPKIRYMRLPMMRNLQRQQRQWVKKYSGISLSWKEKMSCFFQVIMHTDISEKPEDFFTVFLAGIPGENHPLHHPKFQLDERILPYSVEALYKIITTL